jgi:hypothetical protein
MPIEHGMHGTDRRQLDLAVLAADLLADLRCSPARVLALELQDQVLDLKRQPAALPIGSAAAIGQPFQAAVLVPREDLVTGFAIDCTARLLALINQLAAPWQNSDRRFHRCRSTARAYSPCRTLVGYSAYYPALNLIKYCMDETARRVAAEHADASERPWDSRRLHFLRGWSK